MRDGFASATASAAALRVHALTLYIQRALHLLLLSIKLAVHRRDATSPHDTTRCDETRRRTTVLRSADVLFRPDGSLWNGLQCIKIYYATAVHGIIIIIIIIIIIMRNFLKWPK